MSLVNDRLCFESNEIPSEWIPFHSILGLETTGQTLTVLTRKGLARYHSPDPGLAEFAAQLRRLKSTINTNEHPLQTQLLFEKAQVSGEQCRDSCGVALDIERLRIFHNSPNLAADMPLNAISLFQRRLSLEIRHKDQKRKIYGSCARRIAAFLNTMEHKKGLPYRAIVQSWQVLVSSPMIGYTALAVLSDKALIVHPLKWFDVHARSIEIRLSNIAELHFETHALSIHCKDDRSLKLVWDESAIKLGRRLGLLLTQTPVEEPVPGNLSEGAEICGASTLWLPSRIVRRGHMSVNRNRLLFSALGETTPSLSIPLQSICRNDDSDSPLNTLPLRSGQLQLLFHPKGGEAFVNRFYSSIKPPHRRISWESLSEPMRFAWLNEVAAHVQHGDGKSMSALIIVEDKRIMLQPLAGDAFDKIENLQIEFHTQHGRMRFQSRMISTQQGLNARFEISQPNHLELISQRAIARLNVDGWVQGIPLAIDAENGEMLPCGPTASFEMRDISERGCGLSGTEEIAVGNRMLLGLDCLDPSLHIQAICVYVHAMGPQMRWRKRDITVYFYGFQFVLQTMGMRRKMNRLIDNLKKNRSRPHS